MFFPGFFSEGPHLLGIVPKTALPAFFIVQTLKNLRGDSVLFLVGKGLNAAQSLFEQAGHDFRIAQAGLFISTQP